MRTALRLAAWLSLFAAATVAAAPPTPTELFDWAEKAFPQWLPGHQTNRTQAPYVYRYYPESGNYLGVHGDAVHVFGPVSGNQLMAVGRLSDFTCQVFPTQCVAQQPAALAARVAPALGYTLAIDPAGKLLTWGAYLEGVKTEPVPGSQARAISGVPRVAGTFANGSGAGFALTTDGRLFSWGHRRSDGTVVGDSAAEVAGLDKVVDMAACSSSRIALKSDGTLWQWIEGVGEAPWLLDGMADFQALSETTSSDGCQVAAIRIDGSVWRVSGKPGGRFVAVWDQVIGLPPAKQVACGSVHCLAVSREGEVWAWGNNDWGQLGNGSTLSSIVPVKVSGLADIRKVAAGMRSSYALTNSGRVYRWGRHGVLVRIGRITDVAESEPLAVPGAPTDTVDIYARVQASWGGIYMVRRDGTLAGWGPNTGGELIDAARQSYVDVVTTTGTISIGASN